MCASAFSLFDYTQKFCNLNIKANTPIRNNAITLKALDQETKGKFVVLFHNTKL